MSPYIWQSVGRDLMQRPSSCWSSSQGTGPCILFAHYVIIRSEVREADVPFLGNWSAVGDKVVLWLGERGVHGDGVSVSKKFNEKGSVVYGFRGFRSGLLVGSECVGS